MWSELGSPHRFELASGMLKAASVGMIAFDGEQRVVAWNRWMERYTGKPASAVLGMRFGELFPEMLQGRTHSAMLAALHNNFSSLISQTLHKTPFPLFATAADALAGVRIQQAVQVMPLTIAGAARHCLVQVADVSAAVAREQQLHTQAMELQAQVLADGLTGIANRRRFDACLDSELRRAKRLASPLALIMIDVDAFKRYNDHYGHQQGDACLCRVAEALTRAAQRPGDLVARYGGEEFAAVLPETGLEGAQKCARRMREAVLALEIAHADSPVLPQISVSLGIFSGVPGADMTCAQLIEAADGALYGAKREGRNRVALHGAPDA